MGGVVARLAMDDLPNLIDIIMTMSTPHALPPVTLSRDMDTIYDILVAQTYNASAPLLFSICGGTADTQIASDACVIPPSSITEDDGFSIFTTGMPGAWTGVEHQTMVWCHQVRWRVARTLLGMTSTGNRQDKLAVAEEWLLGNKPVTTNKMDGDVRRTPVTSPSMSIRITGDYDTASPVRWCQDEGDCQIVKADVITLPAPKNPQAPFPLPGEGIRPDEKVAAMVVDLPSSTGYLEVYAGSHQQITSGALHKHLVTGKTWSESCSRSGLTSGAGDSDVVGNHINIRFSRASTSSLVVHRLKVDLQACKGKLQTVNRV
jgi:glycosylphosphatidylinositol deacylase